MPNILGHQRQIAYLDRVRERGTMAHAYLFHGPDKIGKRAIALEWIKTLFCSAGKKRINDSCSGCAECKKIEHNTHPNLIQLSLEQTLVSKKETRKEIPIEDIREVIRLFSYAPAGNQWRVLVIDEAEKMSREAADAFLKTVEEPGEQTLIIFITSAPDLIPTTILSRSQIIAFSLVSDSAMREFLEKQKTDSKTTEAIIPLAAGRPGTAKELLSNPEKRQEMQKNFTQLKEILERAGAPEIFLFSERIAADPAVRVQCIEYALGILREKLLNHAGGETSLSGRIKQVDRLAAMLETSNVNPRLALDILLLKARGIVA